MTPRAYSSIDANAIRFINRESVVRDIGVLLQQEGLLHV